MATVKGPMNTEVIVFKSHLALHREQGNIIMSDPCSYAGCRIIDIRKQAGATAVCIEDTAVVKELEYSYLVNVEWYENIDE